jgi:hypothetical protein
VGLFVLVLAASQTAMAGCPSSDRLIEALDGLGLERGSRTERFGNAVPDELYRSAAQRPGRPVARSSGLRGFGVVVVEMPIDQLWRAVNDEDHHALDGDYIPVQISQVIDGEPRGRDRLLFQMFQRWGLGRWWVSRVRMNEELYRRSAGMLWELYWKDEISSADTQSPPIVEVAAKTKPIESSQGSWLMIPLADECTSIEYFTFSEPGGLVGLGQRMLAKRGVLLTLEGLINLAREHVAEHDVRDFVRADGEPLGWSPMKEPGER